jgi:hypothetical protein
MDTSVKTVLAAADQAIRSVEDPATKQALQGLPSAVAALGEQVDRQRDMLANQLSGM